MIDTGKYDYEGYGINVDSAREIPGTVNKFTTFCPRCHADRKPSHQKKRELTVWPDSGYCKCNHCGETWRMDTREWQENKSQRKEIVKKKGNGNNMRTYELPAPIAEETLQIEPKLMGYLTKTRGLSESVIKGMRIGQEMHYICETKTKEPCVVFNYFENDTLVLQKFRDENKHFASTTNCEQIPYNINSALGKECVIVTEGEFDTLAFLTAGADSVVSLPNGANKNLECFNRFYDSHFADKKKVYVATDMDTPGEKAAQEIIRRFGPEVCYRVRFAEDCKDANEQLVKHGAESLMDCIANAQPAPITDIVGVEDIEQQLDEIYQNGFTPGIQTGWHNLDVTRLSFATKQLAIITGRSNDGKSEWTDELAMRLAINAKCKIGYWSPENVQIDHAIKIVEKLTGRRYGNEKVDGLSTEQQTFAKQWLSKNVKWINLPYDKLKLDNILDKGRSLVRAFGIRILVLDPYNFILKETDKYHNENSWDSYAVGRIRQFAIDNDLIVFLVAHPRKVEMKVDGQKRRITIEDIAGTADFGNKADYVLCVDRGEKVVTVYIDKVRRKQNGSKGKKATFVYDIISGRYFPCEIDEKGNPIKTNYDTKSWLTYDDIIPFDGNAETNSEVKGIVCQEDFSDTIF